MLVRYRMNALVGLLGSGLLLFGCVGITDFFQPEFLEALQGTSHVASLPGDAPALLVEVENGTDRMITAMVSYRASDGNTDSFTTLIEPYEKTAQALICPVAEITLGELNNTSAIGAIVRLGAGGANDPYIEVEPFEAMLQAGINYDCGDAITFAVMPSNETLSGYRIYAYIRRADGGG